jgi:hypothetical protein
MCRHLPTKIRRAKLLKSILVTAALLSSASVAIAQNDMVPVTGATEGGSAAVVRTVGFTALGTFGVQGEERLIDVRAEADTDGDGSKDEGVLRIACNGGDILSGEFKPGETTAALKPKPKVSKAGAASPIAAGKTFKGKWNLRDVNEASMTGTPIGLTIPSGQPDICA